MVEIITSDKDVWVDTMMKEELAMTPGANSPFSKAAVTFLAFLVIGFIPLLVYVLDYAGDFRFDLFTASSVLTGLTFIGIGLLKSYVVERPLWRGTLETLLLGGIAAVLAYVVGDWLEKMF